MAVETKPLLGHIGETHGGGSSRFPPSLWPAIVGPTFARVLDFFQFHVPKTGQVHQANDLNQVSRNRSDLRSTGSLLQQMREELLTLLEQRRGLKSAPSPALLQENAFQSLGVRNGQSETRCGNGQCLYIYDSSVWFSAHSADSTAPDTCHASLVGLDAGEVSFG